MIIQFTLKRPSQETLPRLMHWLTTMITQSKENFSIGNQRLYDQPIKPWDQTRPVQIPATLFIVDISVLLTLSTSIRASRTLQHGILESRLLRNKIKNNTETKPQPKYLRMPYLLKRWKMTSAKRNLYVKKEQEMDIEVYKAESSLDYRVYNRTYQDYEINKQDTLFAEYI